MARIVNEMPRRTGKHSWNDWFNGQAWELEAGIDFDTSTGNFRTQAFAAAKRHGVKITTHVDGDTIYLQRVDA